MTKDATKKKSAAPKLSEETTAALQGLGIPEIPGMTEEQAAAMIQAFKAAVKKAAAAKPDKKAKTGAWENFINQGSVTGKRDQIVTDIQRALFDPAHAPGQEETTTRRKFHAATVKVASIMYQGGWLTEMGKAHFEEAFDKNA